MAASALLERERSDALIEIARRAGEDMLPYDDIEKKAPAAVSTVSGQV